MNAISIVGQQVANFIIILLQVYAYVIFFKVILSWFMPPGNNIMQFLTFLTEPVLGPIRKVMQPLTQSSTIPIDLSPIVAYIVLIIITEILKAIF